MKKLLFAIVLFSSCRETKYVQQRNFYNDANEYFYKIVVCSVTHRGDRVLVKDCGFDKTFAYYTPDVKQGDTVMVTDKWIVKNK